MRAAGDSPSGGRGTIQMLGPTVQAWDSGLLRIMRNFHNSNKSGNSHNNVITES